MKIADLFRQLSYGELSNLSISGSGSGIILEEKQPQLVHYLNDGLLAIYTKFLLSEKELVIEQIEHVTKYYFQRKHAETSGSENEYLYIKDLPEAPYQDDLIKVLEVYHSNGFRYPLNDVGNPRSLFTPQPNILQIMNPVQGLELSVIYQASHPKVVDETIPLLDQIIELPIYLENALQLYMAHKVFSHMNGPENIIKGQEYLHAYEAECLEVKDRDLVNQTFHTTHSKLEQRGFV